VWGWGNNCDYEIIVRGLLQLIMTNDGDNEQQTTNNNQDSWSAIGHMVQVVIYL